MRATSTKAKLPRIALALFAALAFAAAPTAFARHGGHHHGHGHYHGGHHRGYGHYHRGYRHGYAHWRGYHGGWHHYRGHHDHAGRWIAGAVIAGALVNIVADATVPQAVYYDAPPPPPPPPMYRPYRQSTVIYQNTAPTVVEQRVYETPASNRAYNAPDQTHYIRDDGWDGHGN